MNKAGVSDDFVIQRADTTLPIHSQPGLMSYVCCDTNRRYLGKEPLVADTALRIEYLERSLNFRLHNSLVLGAIPSLAERLEPGEYTIFLQSRTTHARLAEDPARPISLCQRYRRDL